MCSEWVWVFVLNPCLFFLRCGWCHLLLWNLWYLEQFCSQNPLTSQEHRTKGAREGCQNRSKQLPSRGSEKQVANKRVLAEINQATGSNMGTNIWKCGICWVIGVDDFPHHFWMFSLMDCSIVLGSILASLLWVVWNCSSIIFKPADLCKCTRRQHWNMVFEVCARHTLMIFTWFSNNSPLPFSLHFEIDFEAVLNRFGIYSWSFGSPKSVQNVSKIDV